MAAATENTKMEKEKRNIIFSIPILALVKSAQQQHGLRHGDYQRYHQYITRKLRRMRKSLHFQQGNRSKVVPKKLTPDLVTDPRFITLKLFEIERSWAYAMQLKTESNTELRKRFQMISRLRRAVVRGNQLSDLMNELPMLDAQTKLELRAYIQWIHGMLAFELQDWVKAKEYLESTQAIYTGLLQTIEEDNRVIYTSRMDDILPQIHYCAYNIGDKSAASDLQRMRAHTTAESGGLAELQLDQLLSQARATQAGQVTEAQWLGQTIPVKLEKAKVAILIVKEAEEDLKNAQGHVEQLSIYESVLKSCVDGISAVRDELRAISSVDGSVTGTGDKKLVSAISSDKVSRLQMLCNYLQYLKLYNTIERTLVHIDMALSTAGLQTSGQVRNGLGTSTYTKPQELARLYDTLVQNLQEMIGLPGVVQEHAGMRALLQAKLLAYRSYRCYYLAFTYSHGKRFAECSALLTRAKQHAEEAVHSLSPETAPWTEIEASAVPGPSAAELTHSLTGELLAQIAAEDLTCRAVYMLDMSDTISANMTTSTTTETEGKLINKALIDRLETYLDPKSVEKSLLTLPNPFVSLPPAFEPVPVKPILFDLALNHVNFPSLADKLDHKGGSASMAGKAGAGIAGFVRGWLWGSSEENKNTKQQAQSQQQQQKASKSKGGGRS
ncbi:Signal recognition particle subunit SRP68 [Fasciola hepatica]|uniref:Signal recognition particle subunit SRP68 n=1 Tax=Fasciola hepatica TaxID=6192 RepID=A0A4E0RCL4_FASHE|nr:Signal recognition particle subunit SRP68 [Fasciola hepatica]